MISILLTWMFLFESFLQSKEEGTKQPSNVRLCSHKLFYKFDMALQIIKASIIHLVSY